MPELKSEQILEKTEKEFRKLFLLAFTKEVIKNLHPDLKSQIEQREKLIIKEIDELDLEKIPQVLRFQETPSKSIPLAPGEMPPRPAFKPLPKPFRLPPRLMIPRPQLPQRLQYIQPTANLGVEIDLGKLNSLINDPVIQTIECNGPNERVVVRDPGQKATAVTLTKEEIDNIIQIFANTARIPISEGVFRVAVGKLILSAIVSEVVGSKFIIKKLRYNASSQEQQGASRLQPMKTFTAQPTRLIR